MLGQQNYYWGSIRKVVVAFGTIFSDLHIARQDNTGSPTQAILVPCEYGPKEKWFTRNVQNPMPGVDDQVEYVIPRMAYQISGLSYDSSRHLTSTGRTVKALTNNSKVLSTQFNPVPYNINFNLDIVTKTVEDGLMIVEQILPFFTPDYTINVNDIPELNLTKAIIIVFNGNPIYEDTWDGQFTNRRTITWSLGFTVKAYLYPPVQLQSLNLQTNFFFRTNSDFTLTPDYDWAQITPNGSSTDSTDVIIRWGRTTQQNLNGVSRIQVTTII